MPKLIPGNGKEMIQFISFTYQLDFYRGNCVGKREKTQKEPV
jgi:hypothetical protein